MIYAALLVHVALAVTALELLSISLTAESPSQSWLPPITVTLISGVLLYGVSFLVWLWIVGNADVSRLYPLAVGLISVSLLAISVLRGQQLEFQAGLGVGLILLGVFLVSTTQVSS